ncbi:MAG: hypothetical protein ACKKL5_00065 [Candidatus Komeilibacteria bacterium]
MEKFEREGQKYWEGFGTSLELLPRLHFDFVNAKKYVELLERYDL